MSRVRIAHPGRFFRAVGLLLLLLFLVIFGIRSLVKLLSKPAEPLVLHFYGGNFLEWPESPSEPLEKIIYPRTPYPEEGVKGLYLSAFGATSELLDDALALIDSTALNALVIDYKDDYGFIRMPVPNASEDLQANERAVYDAELISRLKDKGIYLIARIVVFQDPALSELYPLRAFRRSDGTLWRIGHMIYTNPFDKENWDYNVEIAREAAKAGFDEVQYDYVRFPEAFEDYSSSLYYSLGDYEGIEGLEERNSKAITDFIKYSKEQLLPTGIKLGVDLFGYIAFDESVSIGQHITQLAPHIDVLSAMIYPSHWGPGYFGMRAPDLEPGAVVEKYLAKEQELLATVANPPVSRPWLQAFTASYLGEGFYQEYTSTQIEEQIRALERMGQKEYLLWNAQNYYPTSGNY